MPPSPEFACCPDSSTSFTSTYSAAASTNRYIKCQRHTYLQAWSLLPQLQHPLPLPDSEGPHPGAPLPGSPTGAFGTCHSHSKCCFFLAPRDSLHTWKKICNSHQASRGGEAGPCPAFSPHQHRKHSKLYPGLWPESTSPTDHQATGATLSFTLLPAPSLPLLPQVYYMGTDGLGMSNSSRECRLHKGRAFSTFSPAYSHHLALNKNFSISKKNKFS